MLPPHLSDINSTKVNDLEKQVRNLKEENATLVNEIEFHKNEANRFKNEWENLKLQ